METKTYPNDYVSGSYVLKRFEILPKGFHQSYRSTAFPKAFKNQII